jgi:hypothetical protein
MNVSIFICKGTGPLTVSYYKIRWNFVYLIKEGWELELVCYSGYSINEFWHGHIKMSFKIQFILLCHHGKIEKSSNLS